MVTGGILKVEEGLHHRVARSITGMKARRITIEEWEWPPVHEALETAGIWPIKENIQQRQDTVAVQVACCPIYELCKGEERIPGTIIFIRWW